VIADAGSTLMKLLAELIRVRRGVAFSFQYSASKFVLAIEREGFTTDSAMTGDSQYVQDIWT